MWIANNDLKELLDGEMKDYWKDHLRRKLKESEEREKARQEAARKEKERFWAQIAAILKADPLHRYCPTDIQFIMYENSKRRISCSKISTALIRLAYCVHYYYEGVVPESLRGICRDPDWNPKDNRVYYYYDPQK